MRTSTPSGLRSKQGFTLIEVLVSSFITLILMYVLFLLLLRTLDAWEAGTERLNASGDARLALDSLKTDLESMIVRQTQYDQEWLYSGPAFVNEGAFETGVPSNDFTRTWLTFFSPALDRDTSKPGDIVAVSYIVAYQDPISPNMPPVPGKDLNVFGLYKALTETDEAFVRALGYPASNPNSALLVEESGNVGYWTDSPYPLPEDSVGLLAPHVVKFSVSWLIRDPNNPSILTRFNERHTVRLSNILRVFDDTGAEIVTGGTIEAAEISITMLSEEGMDRFKFFQKGVSPGSIPSAGQISSLLEEFGSTHTIRVPISY